MELIKSEQISNRYEMKAAFSAYNNSHIYFNKCNFTKIDFNKVKIDMFHCFNELANSFIAPFNGVYSFNAGARLSGINTGYAGLGLFVNDALNTMVDYRSSNKGLICLQGTLSTYLSQGDIFDLRSILTSEANTYLFKDTVGAFIWFSGYMLIQV